MDGLWKICKKQLRLCCKDGRNRQESFGKSGRHRAQRRRGRKSRAAPAHEEGIPESGESEGLGGSRKFCGKPWQKVYGQGRGPCGQNRRVGYRAFFGISPGSACRSCCFDRRDDHRGRSFKRTSYLKPFWKRVGSIVVYGRGRGHQDGQSGLQGSGSGSTKDGRPHRIRSSGI